MDRFFRTRPWVAYLVYMVVGTVCIGLGMGVPVFCIVLGFAVGWYQVKSLTARTDRIEEVMGGLLWYSIVTAGFTFTVMLLLWGGSIAMLFDPNVDYEDFGIPMILFDPKLSFIGWQVLMILIAPFLQVLTTLFASHLVLLAWLKKKNRTR